MLILLFMFVVGFLLVPHAQAGEKKEITKVLTEETVSYTIQSGDTLSQIAQDYGVKVSTLMRFNNLKSSLIYPDQVLFVPLAEGDIIASSRGNITRAELLLLAKAIHAEARGESFEGQVAVGAVILNRLNSPHFPNTIREVIMQRNGKTFQFTPVSDGTINLTPSHTAIKAARMALEGHDPTGGALFFYNPHLASDTWIKTLPVITTIGRHTFATKA